MLVADIHHVSLNVADTELALGFYRDVLGLTPLPRPALPSGGAWLDAGNGRQIHLIEAVVPPDRGQHVAFAVADVDEAVARLRASGIEVTDPRSVGESGVRQAFAHDPDGNRVEFTQPA